MKHTLMLLMSSLLFYSSEVFSQNEILLSGNNSSSVMVCSSGKIMTWGSNRVFVGNNAYFGILAIGNTSTNFVSSPIQVVGTATFNNLTFTQVSAGTGNHFVALACDSTVWAWGSNIKGQVGNGLTGTVVDVPTQVKAGVLTGTTYDDGKGFLKGVRVVHAANNNTFAILRDGRLVSWGANNTTINPPYDDANGQLGDDSQLDKATPVFVVNGSTKKPLTNVKSVSAGDNVVYALIDDDKDGKGIIYSWGNGLNGTLGRHASGMPGNPISTFSATSTSTIGTTALPVQFADGKPLDYITSISAGDGFGLALDINGNVWAWGNNAWGGVTGQPLQVPHADPRKVLKGAVKAKSADLSNTYLKAKSIAGGQGFAMAVTTDGKPVAWGNNTGCIGGVLGNGQSPTSSIFNPNPSYIINTLNTLDSNVIAIYRGDTWGFYVTKENKVMTWGCNENGQLGLGNTVLQTKAVPLAVTNCGFPDPRPFLNLNKKDTSVCTSKLALNPFIVQSGFEVAPNLVSNYQISWYKNGSLVKGPLTASVANLSHTVSTPGTYKAEIRYTGNNAVCFGYEDAIQQFKVTGFTPSYSLPNDLIYDNDTLKPYVIPEQPALNPKFVWFATASSTNPLDTTTGTQKGAIYKNAPGITKGTGEAITLYAEEKSHSSGLVFTKEQSCNPQFNQFDPLNNNSSSSLLFQTQLTAYEPLTLTEFKIMLRTTLFQPGTTLAGNLNFSVYGAKKDLNGRWIPDETNVYGSLTKFFSRTRNAADPMDVTSPLTAVCNIKIPATGGETVFYITAQRIALSNLTGSGQVQLGRANCTQSGVPLFDNVSGKTIALTGTCLGFNNPEPATTGGNFFDIKFETSQQFCERLAVTLTPKITTDIIEETETVSSLHLYPNPSKGIFSLKIENGGFVRILSLQGLEMFRVQVQKGNNSISLQHLPKSTYLVEFVGRDKTQRSKLVIE